MMPCNVCTTVYRQIIIPVQQQAAVGRMMNALYADQHLAVGVLRNMTYVMWFGRRRVIAVAVHACRQS